MPNNLVFNNVANELKTAVYGSTDGGSTFAPISIDSSGNLNVSVVNTANVSVVNTANVSVVNTANVSVVNTANVSVVNTANVSVVNTANVSVVNKVTTLNDFATAVASIAANATTGNLLQEDTSGKMMYSYYVKNNDTTATIVAKLQVSPVETDAYFIDDSSVVATLAPGAATVLVPKNYLNYTRLSYSTIGTLTAAADAYYNAQS